jgi:hypothetical protein
MVPNMIVKSGQIELATIPIFVNLKAVKRGSIVSDCN